MNVEWYLIYVSEKKELKVSSALSKKKIENYCPVSARHSPGVFRGKEYYEPLLSGYIFVKANPESIKSILHFRNIINAVHWKDRPIIVPDEYISSLKTFVSRYQNIRLKKYPINEAMPTTVRKTIAAGTIEMWLPLMGLSLTANLSYVISDNPAYIISSGEQIQVSTNGR